VEPLRLSPRPHVVLRASDVTKIFGETVALWKVNFDARSGELIALHGGNGSGKSTLLRILAGLMAPTRGRVTQTTDDPTRHPRVAYLGHVTHLFDELTALENVVLAARLARREPEVAVTLLNQLGVSGQAGRRVTALSAGTRRRVGLARVLATDPDITLADEPLAGLDADAAGYVGHVLAQGRNDGRLVVVATHDHARSQVLATRVLRLEQGRLRQDEPAAVEEDRHVV
jgi:heme ABC exporter ATP-binding subunit CcmA